MVTEYLKLTIIDENNEVDDTVFDDNSLKIDTEAKRQNGVVLGTIKNVTYNASTGAITFVKVDDTTIVIDLPLELLIDSGYYDVATKDLVLILANMDEIRIPVADLISEYTADNVTMTLNGTVFSLNATYKNKIDETPKFVKTTQEAYDALVTKDDNTIYCIKEEV